MKKKNLFVALLVALFVFIPFVNAEELGTNETITSTINYDPTTIVEYGDTTEGIVLEDNYKVGWDLIAYLNYTITKDLDIHKSNGVINFNVVKDIYASEKLKNGISGMMPSCKVEIHLSIKNETNYVFDLKENDLIITSISYKEEVTDEENTVETFDGNTVEISSQNNVSRTTNPALQALLNTTSTSALDYTDELIKEALLNIKGENGELKYPNGIQDLDKYYVDYFNKMNNTNYTSVYELSKEDIGIIFGSELGSNDTTIKETNKVLAKLGYDYFYNALITVLPEDYEVKECDPETNYSVGDYMRDTAPKDLVNQVTDYINNMDEKEETVMTIYLNGPYMGNAYQNYSFGIKGAIRLTAKSYNVYTKYVDEYGKEIADPETELNKYTGDEYTTIEKVIEGYELIKVEGEKTGVIQDSDVYVTYVYQYVMGEGGEEFDVVQTGSDIDYSLMSSAAITLSLIAIAIVSKRKNNN